MNNTTNLRRIFNEETQIAKNAEEDSKHFKLTKVDDSGYKWRAIIYGPAKSLYEGYGFELKITISNTYPQTPLQIQFITSIQHVNVNTHGDICMDILKNQWTSSLNIRVILFSLESLLSDPNVNDPFNHDLATLYLEDINRYNDYVRSHCKTHAISLQN